jgi:DNA-binding transcriptional ArsR family regulator
VSRPLASVHTVRDNDALRALSHPVRVELLERLRAPASAAEVARQLGQSRQSVNYHLRSLADAGLVEKVGTRRQGNFIESLYRAAAGAFVIAPEVAWSDPRRMEALRRDHSLSALVEMGARLQHDAAALLDTAAFDDQKIASAAVAAETHFASAEDRAGFLREYLEATRALIDKYGGRRGASYRVVLAVHPNVEETAS